jgi:hypothetical protein
MNAIGYLRTPTQKKLKMHILLTMKYCPMKVEVSKL